MAHWRHADRTLHAKLVYYGPALGGKTTNLQALHRITDPKGIHDLLSVNTSDDRTLFFDLLPFDLGTILGYRVAVKVYTVPGQVRYDATRRVVVAGADAVVFVADSSRAAAAADRASLDNLRFNLRANGIEPSTLPVRFQFNKQDLPDAALPEEVATWLGIEVACGRAAVAVRSEGVLETFIDAVRVMLERLVGLANERTRRALRGDDLARQVERAFAPHVARLASRPCGEPSTASSTRAEGAIRVAADELVQQAAEASVRLGDDLTSARARIARLEREAEALRRITDALRSVGASFDRDCIVDAALGPVGKVLEAATVTLLHGGGPRGPTCERAWGRASDPLLASPAGRALARRLVEAEGACVVEDLAAEIGEAGARGTVAGLRAVVAVPVPAPGQRGALLAYLAAPEGTVDEDDVRFMATAAGHLAAGLEKIRLHHDLERHRDHLENLVQERTRALRRAYEDLRDLDRMKDRFLSSLSHEMKTPLTTIVSAGTFLRDYESEPQTRSEMLESILVASERLERRLDDLLRVARLDPALERLERTAVDAVEVARRAVAETGASARVRVRIDPRAGTLRADVPKLVRAVTNLLENALKFSPSGSAVELRIGPGAFRREQRRHPVVAFCVLDRGPGVPAADRERIFGPFEQGGDLLTSKPAGIGLGLHEALVIARKHGGIVRHLDREGGGSEFRLIVPAQETPKCLEVVGA